MKVWRKNDYGFVLINKTLGTRFVFVYQEGLGGVKTEKSPKADPEYQNLDEIEEPTATSGTTSGAGSTEKSKDTKTTEPGQEPATTHDSKEEPSPEQKAIADLEARRSAVEQATQKGNAAEANTIGSFTVDKDERQAA